MMVIEHQARESMGHRPSIRREADRYGTASCPPFAFTLVEVLIVVTILGILAAIVVPRFLSAADESRESTMKSNMWRLRTQLEIYKEEHNGYPTLANFADQMTMASKLDGSTAPVGTAGFSLGPYLPRIANNIYTGTATISEGVVGSSAWYYNQTTGAFHANDTAETRAW